MAARLPERGIPDVRLGTHERPLWRGRLHQWTALVVGPLAAVLVAVAPSATARVSAAIYGLCVTATFAVSATYHRWVHTLRVRALMRRFDHATIYLAIAGTYTPVCLVGLPLHWGIPMLAVVWAAATTGIVAKLSAWKRAPVVGAVLYGSMGWLAVLALPVMIRALGWLTFSLLLAGGICYTTGAIMFAKRWPRLRPAVFGFHEVWHIATVVAAGVQMAAIWRVVKAG
ncbi:MAG: hemolysin III family protein [Acidimicrobiia bacterium]